MLTVPRRLITARIHGSLVEQFRLCRWLSKTKLSIASISVKHVILIRFSSKDIYTLHQVEVYQEKKSTILLQNTLKFNVAQVL